MNAVPTTAALGGNALPRVAAAIAHEARPDHRPDIDGLRGIAVLSVLAVHSFPQWIKGGFIGVDVFFVLSGYLISAILFRSLAAGRFSLLDFYARRVRRIFPALSLVLASCLVFSALFTFPSEARQLGKHVGAGALFVSNIALWREAGYFDLASDAKPLLHLWSLGIEEQFYLVWPLAAAGLFRSPRWTLRVIGLAVLASFLLNVALVADKPVATFFLPPTRLWELMVGALLAHLAYHGNTPVAWLARRLPAGQAANALGWSGIALLAVALLLIDRTDHFPGWWALLPTLGTFALLAAGPAAWVNRHLLAQPVLRFYGAISYPLYLWHWPLLCFPKLLGIPLGNDVRVMILIGSVVLATLTFELVEKPVRSATGGPRLPLVLCAVLALVGLGGLAMQLSDGLLDTYPQDMRGIAAAEFRFDYSDYRVDRCFLRLDKGPESFATDCVDREDPGRKLVMLWGDSHAASLYPGLSALMRNGEPGHRLAQYTAANCPPLMATPLLASPACARVNAFVLERIGAERPATVVLAGHWSRYGPSASDLGANLSSLRDTVAQLRSLGVERVVVFGHLPTWDIPQPRLLLQEWDRSRTVPERSHDHLDRRSIAVDRLVGQALAGSDAVFVSPIASLFDSSGCLVSAARSGSASPMSNDESHLSAAGSSVLVQRTRAVLFH